MNPNNQNNYKQRLLSILFFHRGKKNPIDMGELFRRVFDEEYNNKINGTRALRRLITELRWEGHLIGSTTGKTGHGYYMIVDQEERAQYLQKIRDEWVKNKFAKQ